MTTLRTALQDEPRIGALLAAVRCGSYGGYRVNAVLAAFLEEILMGEDQ